MSVDTAARPDLTAATLLAEAWTPALDASYQLGWTDGHTAGRQAAERDMQDCWSQLAAVVRVRAVDPQVAELERIRNTVDGSPCPQRCDSCSRCIASRAWWARGGRPYLGRDGEAERGAA
ncbi:hypothetical protein [Jatrophihabitans endophyticus]|uniref:hypothetical protein n=1 Tax=Jatrophihabitans endophyticus TaxID=1206085 RepID=UPI0009332D17|nr:hypothetical protein [Jatrophihabitans endophyticus]